MKRTILISAALVLGMVSHLSLSIARQGATGSDFLSHESYRQGLFDSFTCTSKTGPVEFTGLYNNKIAIYKFKGGEGEIWGNIDLNGDLNAYWVEEGSKCPCDKKLTDFKDKKKKENWGRLWGRVSRTGFDWQWDYCGGTQRGESVCQEVKSWVSSGCNTDP